MRNLVHFSIKVMNIFFIALTTILAYGQRGTPAMITGLVIDDIKNVLIGATVKAVHEPSGTQFLGITGEDGIYTIRGVRVGGPYTIRVSYIGYVEVVKNNVFITAGQKLEFNATLSIEASSMVEVVETIEKGTVLSSERTGASLKIKHVFLESMPTLNRGISDFIRYFPQSQSYSLSSADVGTSFAGQDSRFNNLTIDGINFNSAFGLTTIPGGQTNSAPVSLEAIEEIQINLAPYDVRQTGFTGAGVNLVTRSGTNNAEGSIFFSTRNESFSGDRAAGTSIAKQNFNVKQFGGRFGFPLIKNRLFLFINYEQEDRTDPATSFLANRGSSGNNITRVLAADLDSLSRYLKNRNKYRDTSTSFVFDPGLYEGYSLETRSKKALIKLDYNLSKSNKLSFRFNVLKSNRDVITGNEGVISGNRSGNLTALNFQSSNYTIHNDFYSGMVELNSIFGNDLSNSFKFSFTANRDYRNSQSSIFPLVDILKDGTTYTTFGYEPLTPNNRLNSDTWQLRNDLTLYKGRHIFTGGFNFEFYKFKNTFTPTYYGHYVFNSLQEFYNSVSLRGDPSSNIVPRRYSLAYSALPGMALPVAITKVFQPGLYIQDEVSKLNDRLKLIFGIRVDMSMFGNTARNNPEVESFTFRSKENQPLMISTSKLPGAKFMFSPRIGFNLDLKGDQSIQLRGGSGVFSGRPAFVWIANQVSNNGLLSGSFSFDNTSNYPFSSDVTYYIPQNSTKPSEYNIAVTDPSFQFPQLLRTNVGVDFKMPFDMVVTVEGVFSKNLNQIRFVNVNQVPANASYSGPDQRPLFPGIGQSNERLNDSVRINNKITNAILLTNTNKGYSYSFTVQLQKLFYKKFFFTSAYTFGVAKDLMTAGSIAYSSWRDNPGLSGNNQQALSFSDFDQRHRIIAALIFKIPDARGGTGFNLGLQSGNQGRVSYTINGDANGDGLASNDLLFLPEKAEEINFEAYSVGKDMISIEAQKEAYNQFLQSNNYLRKGGRYAERNGYLLPWLTTVDASITRDLTFKISDKKQTIQIRADLVNIGNMINNKWGVTTITTTKTPLQWQSRNTNNQPVYRFTEINDELPTNSTLPGSSLNDVWQMQLGVRYIFN